MSRRTNPHLSGEVRETVFASITLVAGLAFLGAGGISGFSMLAYLGETSRRESSLSLVLLLFFVLLCGTFFTAGWAVVRASWRIIARRGESYEQPSLMHRGEEGESVVGCAVGLLAVLMLLAAVGVGLITIGLTAVALANGSADSFLAGLTFLAMCGAVIFVSVLLLRLRV